MTCQAGEKATNQICFRAKPEEKKTCPREPVRPSTLVTIAFTGPSSPVDAAGAVDVAAACRCEQEINQTKIKWRVKKESKKDENEVRQERRKEKTKKTRAKRKKRKEKNRKPFLPPLL